MTSAPLIPESAPRLAETPRARAAWIGGLALVVALAVGIAILMEGHTPKPADSGAPTSPPPVVLRDSASRSSLDAQGAAALAAGKVSNGAADFQRALDADQQDMTAQIGEQFSQWTTLGVVGEVSSMQQLLRDEPGNPYVQLHLGLVELYAGETAQGDKDLRTALTWATSAANAVTDADVARHADDLLHPDLADGYPPVLALPTDAATPAAQRALTQIRAGAAAPGLRPAFARLMALTGVATLDQITDPALASAVLVGSYDKDDAPLVLRSADVLAQRFHDAPVVLLNRAVLELWSKDTAHGEADLRAVAASAQASAGDRKQAAALLAALHAPA